MNFHILTLFPEMVSEGLHTSILGKAAAKGHISLEAVNIRDYTLDKHKKVDDYPYGGGAGMLMQAQPVFDAYQAVREKIRDRKQKEAEQAGNAARPETECSPRVIYLTPQGNVFSQKMAEEFAQEEDLIFLCGHYEGIDERVLETIVTDYVSIGDYVLTGGELPSMVMIDAISRLVPGVLKNEESAEFESFHDNLLEYPQYTRPEVWQGKEVPPVLLSGDHKKVDSWRLEQSEKRTAQRRPDLYEVYARRKNALDYLMKDKLSHMNMLETIRRGMGEIVFADENGVLLLNVPGQVWMISSRDLDTGERLLSRIPAGDRRQILAHQPFIAESVLRRWGRKVTEEWNQLVYTRKIPLEETEEFLICRLEETDLEQLEKKEICGEENSIGCFQTVRPREYLLDRIAAGELFGIKDQDRIAAVAGVHAEGCIGMLEVLPEYRGRGMGLALETYIINRTLEMGQVPYFHVNVKNTASMELHKKLGIKVGRNTSFSIS